MRLAILTILGAVLLSAPVSVLAQTPGSDWEPGDVFVAIGHPGQGNGGKHVVYTSDAQAKGETVIDPARGFTGGCALDPRTGSLWTTSYFRNTVTSFDDLHPHTVLQTIDSHPATGALAVESIVLDGLGNLYVGSVRGRAEILKYSPDGELLATYADVPIPPGQLGLWMDLASDQETMFYTSRDSWVRTYNLRTGESGTFGRIPEETAYGVRLLPPGDGSGGVLVGADSAVHRLDATGEQVSAYAAPAEAGYFALALAPDGQSFWTATLSGQFYRFDIASLALEVGPIDTGTSRAHGVCVRQGYTAAEGTCYLMDPSGRPVLDDNGLPIPIPCKPLELCGNGVDDDGDGLSDSGDSDCAPPEAVERCDTIGDDDQNGLVNETCPRTGRVGQTIASSAPLRFAAPEDGSMRAYGATGLPTGLSMDHMGAVSGECLAPGSYPVTVSVTRTLIDGTILASSGSFTWTVLDDGAGTGPVDDPTPRARKRNVRAALAALLPTGNGKADGLVEEAVEEIDMSLEDQMWLDDLHLDLSFGKRDFDHERRAVKALLKTFPDGRCGGVERLVVEYTGAGEVDIDIFNGNDLLISFPNTTGGDLLEIDAAGLRKGTLDWAIMIAADGIEQETIHTTCWRPIAEGDVHGHFVIDELDTQSIDARRQPLVSATAQAVIRTAILELVAADRVLARTLFGEVQGLVAVDPDRQAKVDREMGRAEAELVTAADDEATGRPDKAISHYKKAWDHAAKAARAAVEHRR